MGKENNTYVLWLPSWYPNRTDAFAGDFIERHAQAVSLHIKTVVILVTKDEQLSSGEVELDIAVNGNLIVYKAYYGSTKRNKIVEKLQSFRQFKQLQNQVLAMVEKEYGPPALVHVQIAMKAGLLALQLKKKRGLPFIVTEHWSGYYPQCIPNIYQGNYWIRRMTKKVLGKADLFLPVTSQLGQVINDHLLKVPFHTIANVVNTDSFYYQPFSPQPFRFLHVSAMNFHKNPEGLIEAAARLSAAGYLFELLMVGNDEVALQDHARQLGVLDTFVFFQPAIPYQQVAVNMQQAAAFVLFSRFESQPCVLLEALCCGLPVISTRVGGIPDIVNDSNGILVESEDIDALVLAMKTMIEQHQQFNRPAIAEAAKAAFNYNTIGVRHLQYYNQVLQSAEYLDSTS